MVMLGPQCAQSNSKLGPLLPHKIEKRVYHSYSLPNGSISHVPSVFISKDYSKTSSAKKIEHYIQPNLDCDDPDFIEKLVPDIESHITNRIQLFIHQLFTVYHTKIEFLRIHTGAVLQYGLATDSNKQLAAAHSGTLPSLRTDPSNEHNCSRLFLGDTWVFDLWGGTTVLLPCKVNQLDSCIDRSKIGTNSGNDFRGYSINIVNQVAKGGFSPKKGLEFFLERLDKIVKRIDIQDSDHARILACYQRIVAIYQSELERDSLQLFKKIFFKVNSTLNESDFYNEVHKEIQMSLSENETSERLTVASTQRLSSRFNVIDIYNLLTDTLSEWMVNKQEDVFHSNTAIDYVTRSMFNGPVIDCATHYLNVLNRCNRVEKADKMREVFDFEWKKPKNLAISNHFSDLEKLWIVIEDLIKINAKNKPYILLRLLVGLIEPLAIKERANKPIFFDPVFLNKTESNLLEVMESENISIGKTANEYASYCMTNPKVVKLIDDLFLEIFNIHNQEVCQAKMKQIIKISTVRTLSSGLSATIHKLAEICLQIIRCKKNKDEKFFPQKMGTIFIRILLTRIKSSPNGYSFQPL
ncbi:MAG: hypothetical protein ACH350_05925 [Parachlamydiaceae bacterium]